MYFVKVSLILLVIALSVVATSNREPLKTPGIVFPCSHSLIITPLALSTIKNGDEAKVLSGPKFLRDTYGESFEQTSYGKGFRKVNYGKGFKKTSYGKDFKQTNYEEGVKQTNKKKTILKTDLGVVVCNKTCVPLKIKEKSSLRRRIKCSGSILNTNLYLKGAKSCSFFINTHRYTYKKQDQPRIYWELNRGGSASADILTNIPTIMVSTEKKACYDFLAHGSDTTLADAIIALLNSMNRGSVIYNKFFYAMVTSHGAHSINIYHQRPGSNPKVVSLEFVMSRNGKPTYNLISSEHGRRKFLFHCSGDVTQ